MAEIIIIQGPPGAGKSAQSERLIQDGIENRQISHISAGKSIRDIRSGLVDSAFSSIIRDPTTPSPTADAVFRGVIFEQMENAKTDDLILIDGFPRHESAVSIFVDNVAQRRHKLLGLISLEASSDIILQRILARGDRSGEKIIGTSLEDFTIRRYTEYLAKASGITSAIRDYIPVEQINANAQAELVGKAFRDAVKRLLA